MLPSRSKSLSGPASGPKGPVLIEGLLEKKKTFGSSKFFCSLHDGKLWYSEDKVRVSGYLYITCLIAFLLGLLNHLHLLLYGM